MTIYVVTCGDYSDYHIEAMFSTKEKANEYIKQARAADHGYYYNSYRIEEHLLDAEEAKIARGYYECFLFQETGESGPYETGVELASPTDRGSVTFREYTYAGPNVYIGKSYISLEHAEALAIEARQKWLATKGG